MTTTSRLGVSMPMLNQSYEKYPEFAKLADEAGFYSLWDYEFYRNPFITHALCAGVTRSIKLSTGIAAASGRAPNEMANAAADVDELSKGRAILGLSTGGAGWADCYNGSDVDHPVARMREYIHLVRSIWQHHATGEPFEFTGRFYKGRSPPFNTFGVRERLVRPKIPIYLAGIKSKMLQLAGEIAEGALGYIWTPRYVKEYVLPNVALGARKAGRSPEDVDVASLVLCSVAADKKTAQRIARINVGMYVATPGGETVAEYMGLQEDRNALLKALMSEGLGALEFATSDALVREFCISGTPDEARDQLSEYQGLLPHIILHTPYVPPIQQHESEAAFRAMLALKP
jgi:alkanesulfonate monooxygenase SsuD/methylene tetrahydromethanopterin reductase-like flavin-dependent oxidoreductase (luciferase family)